MYDAFDIPGGAEVISRLKSIDSINFQIPLQRCDNGCLIFASISNVKDVDQYIKNLIINDSVKGRIERL